MAILLLVVIYLIFISLGLPDSIIGSSWPTINQSLNIPVSSQLYLVITSSICTIISSFFTPKLVKTLKIQWVVTLSILLTSIGLICVSYSNSLLTIVLSMIPLGLGAGAIDSSLNNYVSLHYKSIHMNLLHGFWGVGTFISPLVISSFLVDTEGWRKGVIILAIIQAIIFIISFSSYKLWSINELEEEKREEVEENYSYKDAIKEKRVIFGLFIFFTYVAIEQIIGLWSSSLAVYYFNIDEKIATQWVSLFFIGITLGRFLSGPISLKLNDQNMIRLGESIIFVGFICLYCCFLNPYVLPGALFVLGLGCAPIYPAQVHATQFRFKKELSSNIISLEMVSAYIANLTCAPLFGLLGENVSFGYLPLVITILFIFLVISNEMLRFKKVSKN